MPSKPVVTALAFLLVITAGLAGGSAVAVSLSADQERSLAESDGLDAQLRALAEQKRYEAAVQIAQRQLSLREESLGPDDVHTGLSLLALGEAYLELKRYADAEAALKRAQEILEKADLEYPDGDANTTMLSGVHPKLAAIYEQQRRFSAAEDSLKRAVARAIEIEMKWMESAPNAPYTVLAFFYRRWADQTAKEGKFAEAEAAYRKSLDAAVASKTLKKDFTGKVLESLAILYDSQGRKADADKARRDAKAIMRSRLALCECSTVAD
jgi:tetratricopeptide (TPR) repeat protein